MDKATPIVVAEHFPLVRALAACFLEDPTIDEYDFVLLSEDDDSSSTTASPFLLESHKLGIAISVLKPLFKQAHSLFHAASVAQDHKDPGPLLDATRALLLINPDMYTAWNVRKQLIVKQILGEAEELLFIDLVFSKHTKKACAWAHRRWCLARLGDRGHEEEDRRLMHELTLTARIAELYPKNYYAWTHRWWVVNRTSGEAVVRAQVAFAQDWGGRHVWDMSAVNFLHHVLVRLVQHHRPQDALIVLEEILALNATQLDTYPGHEALWYQRRGLLVLWVECVWGKNDKDDKEKQQCLRQELMRASHYLENQGPFAGEEGLLWDEASTRKQRVCAWAHKSWVVVRLMKQGGKDKEAGKGLLRHELMTLEEASTDNTTAAAMVPPGYRSLVM